MNSAPSYTILKNRFSRGLPERVRDSPVNEGWGASRRAKCLFAVCAVSFLMQCSDTCQSVVAAHTDCQLGNLSQFLCQTTVLAVSLTATQTQLIALSPVEHLLSLSCPRNCLHFMQPILSATCHRNA